MSTILHTYDATNTADQFAAVLRPHHDEREVSALVALIRQLCIVTLHGALPWATPDETGAAAPFVFRFSVRVEDPLLNKDVTETVRRACATVTDMLLSANASNAAKGEPEIRTAYARCVWQEMIRLHASLMTKIERSANELQEDGVVDGLGATVPELREWREAGDARRWTVSATQPLVALFYGWLDALRAVEECAIAIAQCGAHWHAAEREYQPFMVLEAIAIGRQARSGVHS